MMRVTIAWVAPACVSTPRRRSSPTGPSSGMNLYDCTAFTPAACSAPTMRSSKMRRLVESRTADMTMMLFKPRLPAICGLTHCASSVVAVVAQPPSSASAPVAASRQSRCRLFIVASLRCLLA